MSFWEILGIIFFVIFLISLGITNYYLYKFYLINRLAEDLWDFNLKSHTHPSTLLKILFNKLNIDEGPVKELKFFFKISLISFVLIWVIVWMLIR